MRLHDIDTADIYIGCRKTSDITAKDAANNQITTDSNDRQIDRMSQQTDQMSQQINQMSQYLKTLHLYFQMMRSTLKALTKQVNCQWEVKTPVTSYFKKLKVLSDVASEAASHNNKSIKDAQTAERQKQRHQWAT